MEFHISRESRDKYEFDETLFTITGNVIFANFLSTRLFAQKMNEKRDLMNYPERAVRAGEINTMGLIDEILHYVVELYRQEKKPEVIKEALGWMQKKFGRKDVDKTLRMFVEEFPTVAVYRKDMGISDYLNGKTGGVPNRQVVLEEMMMLWLANINPAFSPFLELFDDAKLETQTSYHKVVGCLHEFFNTQPTFGPQNQNLIDMLRSPAIEVPHSLSGQLQYMLSRWGILLGQYLYRLLSSLDLIKEEEKMFLGFGPYPTHVYEFTGIEEEPERFSADRDWMPHLVLLAKSVLVWLDQLSKQYNQPITQLDQIPGEELDRLANWGFTGLWLIGVWERSKASQKIKQLCGNPEAESSAYSLKDYVVAKDLGGEEALLDLKDRCWRRGIRLASDMVPNHTGIDSSWVIEHPDWFISQDNSPFPSYSFTGQDLSDDERVGVFIDDHYYERSDAAVVFKRIDYHTGDEKYIYHGNDGTSMPWNDTAQLNYLKPEVREAVMQTILRVAGLFPIIRFDAAMTLTKRHYQRLWFPHPGTGGDIPSRADHGLTREEFNQYIPNEFWREVVDRVAQEVPDTLLLAEAFWLMEGYFVRSLGMHRVYNSAFMNMLKNEENEKYRSVIKNTIQFNPEILKRYVNFLNNPDEQTAVAQFGKGDRYFGVCLMMVTMPGLPIFGHGQIEGYRERYGMEYRRAYWDELTDQDLVSRHEREIFPLLRKRYLFAHVENFLLYDFFTSGGSVNENVYAYSNRYGDERGLVVFNNKFENASGWIRTSVGFADKAVAGSEQNHVQKALGEGLALHDEPEYFCIFKDHANGLELIRSSRELCEKGLYVELGAYHYHVFLDFREVQDNAEHHYAQLCAYLDGRGVPSVDEAMKEFFLQPLHQTFTAFMNAEMVKTLIDARASDKKPEVDHEAVKKTDELFTLFLDEVKSFISAPGGEHIVAEEVHNRLSAVLQLENLKDRLFSTTSSELEEVLDLMEKQISDVPFVWGVLIGWIFVRDLGKILVETDYEAQSRSWIDEWLLGKIISSVFTDLGFDEQKSWHAVTLIKILTSHQNWFEVDGPEKGRTYRILRKLLEDQEVQQFIGVNRYQDVLWFNQEAFESLLTWLMTISIVDSTAEGATEEKMAAEIVERYNIIRVWRDAEKESGYQVDKLIEAVK
jgi:glycosidase